MIYTAKYKAINDHKTHMIHISTSCCVPTTEITIERGRTKKHKLNMTDFKPNNSNTMYLINDLFVDDLFQERLMCIVLIDKEL